MLYVPVSGSHDHMPCTELLIMTPSASAPTGSRLTSISAVIRMDIKRFTLSLIVLSSCFISKRHYPCFLIRSKRICGQTVRRLKKKISEKRARHSCAACSVGSVFQPKISALTRQ